MPPPLSASLKPSRSESSTPVVCTPSFTKESTDFVNVEVNPLSRKTSISGDPNISTNGNEMALPKSACASIQPPVAQSFIRFAQSIMATTTVNMKLESVKELTAENVKESRRQEKHIVAYASLVDLTSSNCGTIQRARTKLEKQFERYSTNQELIANSLEATDVKRPISRAEHTPDHTNIEVTEELKRLQRDLREVRRGLEDQQDKAIRQKDLDRFARKTARLEDLEQTVTKEELLEFREELLGRFSQVKKIENEMSTLANAANKGQNRAQATQEKNEKRFQDLSSEASGVRDTSDQRFSSTQSQIAELKDTSGSVSKGLETAVDTLKGDFTVLREELEQLRAAQIKNEISIHGDSSNCHSGLIELIEKCSQGVSQLMEKFDKLDEKIIHDLASPRTQSVAEQIESVRQHATEDSNTTEELKQEFDVIADDFGKFEEGFNKLKDEFYLFKEAQEKSQLQPVLHSDHVKLEKIENNLQSLSLFTKTQQMKFDNLTTEDLARNIIHQTKQLYKEHPGHVHDKLRILEDQQRKVDAWIMSIVQPRLLNLETQINLRAGNDALNHLDCRVQTLETFHNRNTMATLSKELQELESKRADMDKRARERHDRLRSDVEILNREIYAGAAGNRHREAQLEKSLKYKDLIETHNDGNRYAKHLKGAQPTGETISRASPASMSSSRQESVVNELVRPGSVPAAVSETSIIESDKRKRKRGLQRSSDDESNDGNDSGHRAAGKGPR